MNIKIQNGVAHKVPDDLRKMIASKKEAYITWGNITALARNEWICWVMSAKKSETRERRIRIAIENLSKDKHRPCCWAGCIHR